MVPETQRVLSGGQGQILCYRILEETSGGFGLGLGYRRNIRTV